MWKEIEMALNIKSKWGALYLKSLSDNIKVLRHPEYFISISHIWSHHEKLLIVD